MGIPTSITDLSTNPDDNSPAGTDSVGPSLDNYLRAIQAIERQVYDAFNTSITSIQDNFFSYLTTVAGTNTITATLPNTVNALIVGTEYKFIPAASNTGVATINVTGSTAFGAKNIWLNGIALVGYELRKNCPVSLLWDGTRFHIISGAHGDGVPISSAKSLASTLVPNGHLLCYGQAVSRSTYADLFAVMGTTHGAGDGTTTFNLPDMRGRAPFGRDDMGGTAANRITTGSGISGTTLGAIGGSQALQSHSHTGTTGTQSASHYHNGTTDPNGAHAHNVPASGTGGAGFLFKDGADTGSPQATDTQGLHSHTYVTSGESGTHTHDFTSGTAGTGGSQNMPPAIIFNWVIKF